MLVASPLPGQMAQLLGEEEASWRGVTALQRAQSSRGTEVLTAANAFTWEQRDCPTTETVCVSACVYSLLSMVFSIRSIKIKERKTHSRQNAGVNRCARTGSTTSQHASIVKWQSSCFEWMSLLSGSDTAVQTRALAVHLCVEAVSHASALTQLSHSLNSFTVNLKSIFQRHVRRITSETKATEVQVERLRPEKKKKKKNREWLPGQWPLCSGKWD